MKTYLTLLFLSLFYSQTISAQSFTLLATDSTGDATIGSDITKVHYRMDAQKDSIWFKIETTNAITVDHGFMIGLDTNKSENDGENWKIGTTATSRKYDHALFIAYDFNTGTALEARIGLVNNNTAIASDITMPDTNVLVVGVLATLLDVDKNFNLLIGAGAFDIAFTGVTIDQSPETGYFTVNSTATSVNNDWEIANFSFYPNPTSNTLYWDTEQNIPNNAQINVYNILGENLAHTDYSMGALDISNLKNGVYFIQFNTSCYKFIKQ